MHISKSITVKQPRQLVYQFWRDFEQLPQFMQHLQAVTRIDDRHTHWIASGPAGTTYEWDAELITDDPNERIAWRSAAESDVRHGGIVSFRDAPSDRGTEVEVQLDYEPPAGTAGATVAKLFGEEPSQQLRDDLRRFKQVMETGEVVRSEGSLHGAGQGASTQRAAQAPESEVRR